MPAKGGRIYAACTPATTTKGVTKRKNEYGWKRHRRERRAVVKDSKGLNLSEFFFNYDEDGIHKIAKIALDYRKCEAVIE